MQPALAPAPHVLQPSAQDNAEQSLREHLLAQVHSSPTQTAHSLDIPSSSPSSPQVQNIDPAIAGSGMMSNSAGESGGDDNGSDGKKGGKRELSTSKRAAQNRAAQRAFRQRKEGYIKKLEEQVRDYNILNENYKAVQAENYQLRDYIINLQSRLIESQGDFPQPPSNINLPHPQSSEPAQHGLPAPTATMGSSVMTQLQASAAQAVADLRTSKNHSRSNEDTEMRDHTDPRLPASSSGPPPASAAA